tara:strand:+ start:1790 stop:2314 length:525 start_codon:yes stop_codon:yes gene_type:complete
MRRLLNKIFGKKYVELSRFKNSCDVLDSARFVGRSKKEIDSCLDYYLQRSVIFEKYPKNSVLRKSGKIGVIFYSGDVVFDENEIIKENFGDFECLISPCVYTFVLNQIEVYEGGRNKRGDLFKWHFGNGFVYLPENINDAILENNWFKYACDVYVAQEKKYGWIDELEGKFKFW